MYTSKEVGSWLRVGDTVVALDKVLFLQKSSLDPGKVVVVFDKETQTYLDANIDEVFKLLEE